MNKEKGEESEKIREAGLGNDVFGIRDIIYLRNNLEGGCGFLN